MARILSPSGSALILSLGLLTGACDNGDRYYALDRGEDGDNPFAWFFNDMPVEDGPDGGADAAVGDGGPGDEDGGTDGPGSEYVDLEECSMVEEDRWETAVEFSDEGGFDLQPGPTGFGLAYQYPGGCSYLGAMRIPSNGLFPGPHEITLRDKCVVVREAALLHHQGSWYTAWVDNSDGDGELFSARLDPDMGLPSMTDVVQVTDNARADAEKRPIAGIIADRPYLAWVGADGADNDSLWLKRLDSDAEPVAIVAPGDGRAPTRAALGQVGVEEATRRGVIAWAEPDAPTAKKGVWLLPLSAEGAPEGEPIRLSDNASVGQSVDVARHESGGAVVYTIDIDGVQQVRWQRLGLNGRPVGDERRVIGNPQRGRDASIYPLSRGYVIAYRALPGGGITEPEIRIAFITKDGILNKDASGNVLSFPVAKASYANARVSVKVSNEGQIMVAWIDEGSQGTTLNVHRRRLDCR